VIEMLFFFTREAGGVLIVHIERPFCEVQTKYRDVVLSWRSRQDFLSAATEDLVAHVGH